jgi:hypothetical protein
MAQSFDQNDILTDIIARFFLHPKAAIKTIAASGQEDV